MNRKPSEGSFGGFLPGSSTADVGYVPGRNDRPPKVWGTVAVAGEHVVVSLAGWRAIVAMRRTLAFPVSSVVAVAHDPAARRNVSAKLRRKGGRTGLVRVGPYHSLQGWSFWSVGLARHAVVIETTGVRYRYVVIEVADPARTVEEVRRAAGIAQVYHPPWTSRPASPGERPGTGN